MTVGAGRSRGIAGLTLPACLIGFSLAPFLAFIVRGGTALSAENLMEPLSRPGVVQALGFSVSQALCSTAAALVIGLPGAWLVGRFRFRGRSFLMALSALPFCLPPLLVVLAFVAFYGNAGIATAALRSLGLRGLGEGGFLYGFWGIVTVHAFYNFPLVLQTVGAVWSRIPRAREEAARTLGAGPWRAFCSGTLPSLLPSIAQASALVFLFSFFSFTVVLVFGSLAGSTLEVAIYRAVRFSGDSAAALSLSILQAIVALAAVGAMGLIDGRKKAVEADLGGVEPGPRPSGLQRLALVSYFLLIAVFFLGPLAAICVQAFTVRNLPGAAGAAGFGNFARILGSGLRTVGTGGSPLAAAIAGTLATAIPAALIATTLGVLTALAARRRPSRMLELSLTLPLAASSAVTATGYGLLFPDGAAIAVSMAQASLIWPFAARAVSGAFSALDDRPRNAARTLGASPFRAFVDTDLRLIGPSIVSAGAFAFSMAAGDANIPLALGSGELDTLPLLVYRLASSYRFAEASAAGLVLALISAAVFYMKEKSAE